MSDRTGAARMGGATRAGIRVHEWSAVRQDRTPTTHPTEYGNACDWNREVV